MGRYERAEEDGWSTVVCRKKTRQVNQNSTDVAGCHKQRRPEGTTKFFFSQFSENNGAKEMLRIFRFYGDAAEVVIPPKRDKLGRRFGFVRFWYIRDPDRFAVKLNNIIIGSTKIHVNCPRFKREVTRPAMVNRYMKRMKREELNVDHKGKDTRVSKWKEVAGKEKVEPNTKNNKKVDSALYTIKETLEGDHGEKGRQDEAQQDHQTDDNRNGAGEKLKPCARRVWNRKRRWKKNNPNDFKGLLCYDVSEEEM